MQSTIKQKNGNVFYEGCVFFHVGHLSPTGYDELSEAVRMHETKTHPAERQNGSGKTASPLSHRPCRHHVTTFLWPIGSQN